MSCPTREQEALRSVSLHHFSKIQEENEELKKEIEELRQKEPKITIMLQSLGRKKRTYRPLNKVDFGRIFKEALHNNEMWFRVTIFVYGVAMRFNFCAREKNGLWTVPSHTDNDPWACIEYDEDFFIDDLEKLENTISKAINEKFKEHNHSFCFIDTSSEEETSGEESEEEEDESEEEEDE